MLKAGQELKKDQYFSLKKVMNKTVEAISIFKAKFEIFTIKKKRNARRPTTIEQRVHILIKMPPSRPSLFISLKSPFPSVRGRGRRPLANEIPSIFYPSVINKLVGGGRISCHANE